MTHFTTFAMPVSRAEKEARFGDTARAIWLFGRPAAGKTTLARALERRLHTQGFAVHLLDADTVRQGLNKDLGFDPAARGDNIRRLAETAHLFVEAGIIVICAAITPARAHRELTRSILGPDLLPVYLRASFETCAERDTKELYKRALRGEIRGFTGVDSVFEEPRPDEEIFTIDTEQIPVSRSFDTLLRKVVPFLEAAPVSERTVVEGGAKPAARRSRAL